MPSGKPGAVQTPAQQARRARNRAAKEANQAREAKYQEKHAIEFWLRTVVSETSPFVLTKMGRIEDLTDEDLEGFDFVTGDGTELRAFIDSLDDDA